MLRLRFASDLSELVAKLESDNRMLKLDIIELKTEIAFQKEWITNVIQRLKVQHSKLKMKYLALKCALKLNK